MATKHIGSVSVATETTYGNIDATTGKPTQVGLVYRVLEIADRAQITQPGEPIVTQVSRSRAGAYNHIPDPSLFPDGTLRRNGTLSLTTPVRGIGDKEIFASFGDSPFHMLLATCFKTLAESADTTASANGTLNEFVPTARPAGPLASDGRLIARGVNGRWDYASIYDFTATPNALLVTPDMSGAVASGEAIKYLRNYYIPSIGMPGTGSVSLHIKGDGWQAICYGCNVTKLTFAMDEASRRLTAQFDLDCAYIEYVSSGSPSSEEVADGSVAHQLGAYAVLGTTGYFADSGGQGIQGREQFCLDAFSLEFMFNRQKAGCGETILGHNRSELVDVDSTMTLTVSGVYETPAEDLFDERMRPVLVGFGGGTLMSEGNGFCVYMPGAVIQNDAGKREFGKDYLRTTLTYKNGLVGPASLGLGSATVAMGFGV